MDKTEILQQIQQQKEYLPVSAFKDCKERVNSLKLLYKNINLLKPEIFAALKADLNKSEEESYMAEIGIVLSEISYMIKHCKRFARPKRVRTALSQCPGKAYRIPTAYGSVLIISPWNYPFMLSLDPLVDAIAAGNCVVLKPSQTSPHVSDVLEKLIRMTFTPEQVVVAKGGREECDFLLEQDWDYIFFTGSTRVGKTIMEKAAKKFIPVTLEMGGKSPCIVDETANIPLAAKRIVFGKFLNCGQTCVAPDYIYCAKSVKDQLIKEISRQIVLQYSVDPISNESYPKLINKKQYDWIVKLLSESKVVFGGRHSEDKLKIEPTIAECSFDDLAMQEEIFGPLLPVVTFDSVDEVIDKMHQLPKPLAFYVFSANRENQNKLISSCDFGGGCVNDTILHLATSHMGFGGLKQSGLGAYHGKIGFDTFSHYKSVLKKSQHFDIPVRYQPYGKIKYFFMKLFLK